MNSRRMPRRLLDAIIPADATSKSERHDGMRGQALTEFAIVMPVFFLVVAGMFDFGLGLYTDLTLVNAAREGARIGVVDPGNSAGIKSQVYAMSSKLDQSKMKVNIACERPLGDAFTSCSDPQWQPGDATVVRVDYKYAMFFPLLFGKEIDLSSEMRMRIE